MRRKPAKLAVSFSIITLILLFTTNGQAQTSYPPPNKTPEKPARYLSSKGLVSNLLVSLCPIDDASRRQDWTLFDLPKMVE